LLTRRQRQMCIRDRYKTIYLSGKIDIYGLVICIYIGGIWYKDQELFG
jgi:hypothetical protein